MRLYFRILLLLFILFGIVSRFSMAEESMGVFGDWAAYRYVESGDAVCSLSSAPLSSEGKYNKRGAVYMHLTRWASKDWSYNVSLTMGYPIKSGSHVTVKIGDKNFAFMARGENAFLPDSLTKSILREMRRGNRLSVSGVSERGTKTRDVFSLSGVTKGLQAMQSCRK